jgi:UDP-N-acetylmuramoylalanine--D-glutamate ligase
MKKNSLHKNQQVLVVGAGKSGMAACRLLKSKGVEVCLTDGRDRKLLPEEDQLWLDENNIVQEFGTHHASSFLMADLIVVSPGVPLTIAPLVAAGEVGVEIIGELELGSWFFAGEIIAITGTNGKTTVTSMIGKGLQKSGRRVFVGGNIGTPLCSHVLEAQQADVAVLEVSSFQLDTIKDFHPKVALLLNISPDHLDRYENYGAYADSKMQLFVNQHEQDVAIINSTDNEVQRRKGKLTSSLVEFADAHWHVDAQKGSLTWQRSGTESDCYTLSPLQVISPNVQNCMAAISGCHFMGVKRDTIQAMLQEFTIADHRLTHIAEYGGVGFIDDSKATNIGAVHSALAGMDKPVILIAGGRDKGGDYSLLDTEVSRIVKTMILIGEAAVQMKNAFSGRTTVCLASSMKDAVEQAKKYAVKGDIVLLSPACASFDMYSGYAERGEKFAEAVVEQGGRVVRSQELMRQAV